MSKSNSGGSTLKGLTNKSPAFVDASFKAGGGNVSKDATRSSVAPNPKTLGPRDA